MTTSTQDRQMEVVENRRGLWTTALIAGVVAVVINLFVYFLATTVFNVQLQIAVAGGAPMPLTPVPVIAMSFFPAIGAAVLLWILKRFMARPYTVFLVIAALVFLLSLGGPLSLPIAGLAKVILGLMHLVAAAVIVSFLAPLAK